MKVKISRHMLFKMRKSEHKIWCDIAASRKSSPRQRNTNTILCVTLDLVLLTNNTHKPSFVPIIPIT